MCFLSVVLIFKKKRLNSNVFFILTRKSFLYLFLVKLRRWIMIANETTIHTSSKEVDISTVRPLKIRKAHSLDSFIRHRHEKFETFQIEKIHG